MRLWSPGPAVGVLGFWPLAVRELGVLSDVVKICSGAPRCPKVSGSDGKQMEWRVVMGHCFLSGLLGLVWF